MHSNHPHIPPPPNSLSPTPAGTSEVQHLRNEVARLQGQMVHVEGWLRFLSDRVPAEPLTEGAAGWPSTTPKPTPPCHNLPVPHSGKTLGYWRMGPLNAVLSDPLKAEALVEDLKIFKEHVLASGRAGLVWGRSTFIDFGKSFEAIMARYTLSFTHNFSNWEPKNHTAVFASLAGIDALGMIPLYGFYFFENQTSHNWSACALVI